MNNIYKAIIFFLLISTCIACTKEPVWIGRLYQGQDLPEPYLEEVTVSEVYFFNAQSFPFSHPIAEHTSTSWFSCLRLNEAALVFFELASDDGNRLFVNDREVISSWKEQLPTGQTKAIYLEKGIHKIYLQHFQATERVVLYLKIRIGQEGPPRKLDARYLIRPVSSAGKLTCPVSQ